MASIVILFYCFQFAADFTEKTLFKTIMVRLLKTALANQDDDFSSVLTEEILAVDKQLLQVERATNEVSGMSKWLLLPQKLYVHVSFTAVCVCACLSKIKITQKVINWFLHVWNMQRMNYDLGLKRGLCYLRTRHSLPDGYPGTRYSESCLWLILQGCQPVHFSCISY